VAVSYSILALSWHFPSDVVGAYLVAATWMLVAVAALEALGARRSGPAPSLTGLMLAAAAGGAAGGGAVALARPATALTFAVDHPAFVVGAALIPLTALSMAAAMARATRV
jgi:hypothetical protein